MICETVSKSRTVRSFDEKSPVTEDILLKLIDTARLSPCARNAQPLRYRLVTDRDECEKLTGMSRFAAALPEKHLPPEGHHPTAYIVVCTDTDITSLTGKYIMFDAGIACQTIMLRAAEEGIGGVILASFDPEKLVNTLSIPEKYEPVVIIALGKPDEKAVITDVGDDGNINYYRDENNIHYVPKRSLEDVMIK